MFQLLLIIIYLSFISLGLPDSLLGSAWPTMYPQLGVPVSYSGIVFMIISVGTIISSLQSDRLTRRLGTGKVTVISVAMTAVALILMGMMCFGLYPALASTVFAPRAMYGFGVLLTVFGMTAAEGKKRFSLKIPAVVLSWIFFVFAFTYGNALSVQKDYTDFRTQLVISDLQEMEAFQSDTPVTVQLSGSIGNAPVLRNMPQNYQMLNRLIPGTFSGGDDLTQYGFYCYYGMRNVVWNPDVDLREMDLPVLEDNMYHTIRGEGSCVLVELK